MHQDRRRFLKSSGIVLSVVIGADILRLSPAAARAAGVPYLVLSADEASILQALAEAVVPGARDAGIAQYIDKQLAASRDESLLMLKYLGVPEADFIGFYQSGLRSAARLAHSRYGKTWPELDANQTSALLAAISSDQPGEWDGASAAFFFFVIRSDACDVVYGTEEGFARVGMPYMAHITPPEAW